MLTWARVALVCLLSISSSARAKDHKNIEPAKTEASSANAATDETSNDGSSDWSLGNLFGGDDKAGRFIDGLKEEALRVPMPDPTAPSGTDLARRNALGPNTVPLPLPSVQQFLENIIRRILDSGGISGFDPKVEIVSKEDIWGAAFPDGTVLLSLGVLRNLKSEDEVAAIMAHEISHVLLRHHGSDWFMESQQRGLAAFNLVLDAKEQIEKQQGKYGGDDESSSMKNRMIAETIVFSSEILLDSPFSREQEDDADILGTDLLIKAGYSRRGMTGMFRRLAAQEKRRAEEKQRAADRRRKAGELNAGQESGGFFSSLGDALSEVGGSIKSGLRDEFGKNHRPAKERRAEVSRYLENQYADQPRQRMSKDAWKNLISRSDVAATISGYRTVIKARQSLAGQDLKSAVQQVRQALVNLPGSRHVLPRSVAAEISASLGDFKTAAMYYREGLSGYLPTAAAYIGLAEALSLQGRTEEASEVIALGSAELRNPPQLLPAKIAVFYRENRTAPDAKIQSTGTVAECRLEGLDGLTKQCEKAAEGKYTVFITSSYTADVDQLSLSLAPIEVVGTVAEKTEPAVEKQETIAEKPRPVVLPTVDVLNARKGPGKDYEIVLSYRRGDRLTVLGEQEKWLNVGDSDGNAAWVAGWLTTPSEPPATDTAAVENPVESSIADRLRQLEYLREQGLVSDSEYAEKRQKILDAL